MAPQPKRKDLTGTPQQPPLTRCAQTPQPHILFELRLHAPSAHRLRQLRSLRRTRSCSDQEGKETRIIRAGDLPIYGS